MYSIFYKILRVEDIFSGDLVQFPGGGDSTPPQRLKSRLLSIKNKNSKDVLMKINDFISHYSIPKIIYGKEFNNSLFKDYCKNKNIQLINSGVSHHTVMEL